MSLKEIKEHLHCIYIIYKRALDNKQQWKYIGNNAELRRLRNLGRSRDKYITTRETKTIKTNIKRSSSFQKYTLNHRT